VWAYTPICELASSLSLFHVDSVHRKGEEGVEPMMGGVRGQAWPAPIGQGDVAKYSALDVIVLILFPFTPCGQKERKREGKERERGEGRGWRA
jgi:hypothetical protein